MTFFTRQAALGAEAATETKKLLEFLFVFEEGVKAIQEVER